jgi:hypothetical protein
MVLKNYLERKYGKRVQIKAYPAYVDNIPLEELTSHDMLILGVDNERTKLFVTYHRMRSNKPMAVFRILGLGSLLHAFNSGQNSLLCLFIQTQ